MTTLATPGRPSPSRWWTYQRERFPVFAHGLLIAAFSLSAISYSSLLRGSAEPPNARTVVVAFVSSFLFFLQLRISDEFKDAEEDARFRPYRPVPRGLVTLRELGLIGVGAAAVQLTLALWLHPPLIWLLVCSWAYLAVMGREFFAARWLRAHPVHYLWSHMVILPIIDLYLTACDWLPAGGPPRSLVWLLLLSFSNGVVVEIGRKLRSPADEETGVETYSALWGRFRAIAVWLAAMTVTGVFAIAAAGAVQFTPAVAVLVVLLLTSAVVCAATFLRMPAPGSGKRIEAMSGVWTLLVYCSVGLAPLAWKSLA